MNSKIQEDTSGKHSHFISVIGNCTTKNLVVNNKDNKVLNAYGLRGAPGNFMFLKYIICIHVEISVSS